MSAPCRAEWYKIPTGPFRLEGTIKLSAVQKVLVEVVRRQRPLAATLGFRREAEPYLTGTEC